MLKCLLGMLEKWKKSVDNGKAFGALLTDVSKLLIVLIMNFSRLLINKILRQNPILVEIFIFKYLLQYAPYSHFNVEKV